MSLHSACRHCTSSKQCCHFNVPVGLLALILWQCSDLYAISLDLEEEVIVHYRSALARMLCTIRAHSFALNEVPPNLLSPRRCFSTKKFQECPLVLWQL